MDEPMNPRRPVEGAHGIKWTLRLIAAGSLLAGLAWAGEARHVWGSFTTTFDHTAKDDRALNIRQAAKRLNGTIVPPGRVFSFNDAAGEGYGTASTLVEGRRFDAEGGGLCQVSTTLYNAVLLAGLGIVERSPHSGPVAYARSGLDAAVSPDEGTDFKFRNQTKHSVTIRSTVDGNRLFVTIHGREPLQRKVALSQLREGGRITSVRTILDATGEIRREVLSIDPMPARPYTGPETR